MDDTPKHTSHHPCTPAAFSLLAVRDRVVIMLLHKKLVRSEHVEAAWQQREKGSLEGKEQPLWRVLALNPELNRERIYAEAAKVYGFKRVRVSKSRTLTFLREIQDCFTEATWARMGALDVVPIARKDQPQGRGKHWIFATHDPLRPEVRSLLREFELEGFDLCYARESTVKALLAAISQQRNEYIERVRKGVWAYDLGAVHDKEGSLIDEKTLDATINSSSLINLLEATLVEAVRQGASDIHIFPNARKQIEIHFRIDGELGLWHVEQRAHPEAFLAVVKDNAMNVDRFEQERGQDGSMQRWIDRALVRFRVSVLPVASVSQEIKSESIVIRVLDDRKVITELRTLGLLDGALERFNQAIREPQGMVILTGPTGSGKSTTLYAALHQVVTPKLNVLTVEDPVEYILPSVRQIKLSHKFHLEEALRSILRHDPDVVMVGEMRDRQTAELAIKLANTGHLTFSTLHTNDAPSAVSRLYKMGIEPFLIAYAINLVVAQRLIRRLCPECRVVDEKADMDLLGRLGFQEEEIAATTFYRAGRNESCATCRGSGYRGRRAITEAMSLSKAIRRIIVTAGDAVDEDAIRLQAIREGMLTLQDAAREVVKRGETGIDEMLRVTGSGNTSGAEAAPRRSLSHLRARRRRSRPHSGSSPQR